MKTDCPECRYLREERAGIHEFEGKLPRWQAENLARGERCERHQDGGDIKAQMDGWAMRKKAREEAMGRMDLIKEKGAAA
jgi:hypothetical protein